MSARRSYSGCGPIPPQVVRLLPSAEAIAEALARTVFASQWGDAIERANVASNYPEREESERDAAPEGFEVPNLSGVDLCEAAPFDSMPLRFGAYARDVVAQAVALAFAEPDGMKALERWEESDSAELGHTFALEAMGTGAAEWEEDSDADLVPTCDCDGRLYLSLGEVHEPDAPTDSDLRRLRNVRGEALTDSERGTVAAWIVEPPDDASASDVLEHVADLLGFGDVQSLTLPDDDDTRLEYVNAGDTYADTLTHDGERFRVQSWGAALEASEEARTFETGETRCPACSEWGDLLGGEPCGSCGHTEG